MSVNVLEYNEVADQFNTLRNTTLPAQRTCYITSATAAASLAGAALASTSTCKQANYGIRLTCDLQTRPWDCRSWSSIPALTCALSTFRVCDNSASCAAGQIRCGASCTWTVPTGATTARFQIWGAGAGSHNACCCGGGMWGGSGAYASVILPVTAGCQYTICAGCAACCTTTDAGSGAVPGCASYVTGFGLCNFCAEGGESSPYGWLQRASPAMSGQGICVIMNNGGYINRGIKSTIYGWCMCNGGGFCWNTCSGRDVIPFSTSCKTWYGCITNPNKGCHFVIGAPGMFNSMNTTAAGDGWDGWTSDVCSTVTHPPIVNLTCDTCCKVMGGVSCGGIVQHIHCGVFPFPSRGGASTSATGGVGNCAGGVGGGGMVIVEWNGE